MTHSIINPWTWQEPFGFSQAIHLAGEKELLFCSGQTSVNDQGVPLHPGNMEAQLHQCLTNLETLLHTAGYKTGDIVRLTYYTTDVAAFGAAAGSLTERLRQSGCLPASTLLGISALFHPDILVEIEAVAAKPAGYATTDL